MALTRTHLVYFSPTGTTRTVVKAIGRGADLPTVEHDLTRIGTAPALPSFPADEMVVLGFPVYMGRIPEVVRPHLLGLHGAGSPCVLVGVYGNRAFDDFLVELEDIALDAGMVPVAAAAFLGEHSITPRLAPGRPDRDDIALAEAFGLRARDKANGGAEVGRLPLGRVPGSRPYGTYSASRSGKGATERLANGPTVGDGCTVCGACALLCPIGNIDPANPGNIDPYACIRCHACVRGCPEKAIAFLKPGFLRHVADLEEKFATIHREPTLII